MQRLALIAMLASILCHGLACGYSDLIVFGDSLSDVGNTNANSFGFAGADPYWMGRFSNGEVYVDYLAPLLGLDAPNRSGNGGSIYAHGGAQVALNSNVIVNSLRVQADDYLDSTSSTADPDALYIVFGGGNDARDPGVNLTGTVNSLVGIVSDLLDAGAETIIVPNLPDLGITPEVTEFGQGAGAASTARSIEFNTQLTAALDGLDADEQLVRFDVFGSMELIVEDAASGGAEFGITNVVDDCWEGGPATLTSGFGLGDPFLGSFPQCDNPDAYLFWDIVHPTTAAHEVLAGFLHEQLTTSTVVDADFNDDDQFDCNDVDSLVRNIVSGANDTDFDLTGDGMVDINDLDAWRLEAGEATFGAGRSFLVADANLDGRVDISDFNLWNANKFSPTSAWCSADFNADGNTDISDFNLWNANKFQTSSAATLPEPGSYSLVLMAAIVLLGFHRN